MSPVFSFVFVFYILCNGVQNYQIPQPYYPQNFNPHLKTEIIDIPDDINQDISARGIPAGNRLYDVPTRLNIPDYTNRGIPAGNNFYAVPRMPNTPDHTSQDLSVRGTPSDNRLHDVLRRLNTPDYINQDLSNRGIPTGNNFYGVPTMPNTPHYTNQDLSIGDILAAAKSFDAPINQHLRNNDILAADKLSDVPTKFDIPIGQNTISQDVPRSEQVQQNVIGQNGLENTRFNIPIGQNILSQSVPQSEQMQQNVLGQNGWTNNQIQQNTVPNLHNGYEFAKPLHNFNLPNQNIFQNYPNMYPYPYHTMPQRTPAHMHPSYPYNFPYRSFLPGNYMQQNYPELYRHFPSGVFIVPEGYHIIDDNTVNPKQLEVQPEKPKNNVAVTQNTQKQEQIIPQIDTSKQTNPTSTVKHHTFTSNMELKPVTTVVTRFTGPDGKTYVQTSTSDGRGKENVKTSENTGAINLKITNGVVDSASNSTKIENVQNNVQPEPNSVLENNEEEDDEEYEDEEAEEEEEQAAEGDDEEEEVEESTNSNPLDITSWLS